MAVNVLVDAGFVVALVSRRDSHHEWAVAQSKRLPPPWKTCEAALSEAFHLLGKRGGPTLRTLLRRGAVIVGFDLAENQQAVLKFMDKYEDIPASLAEACLVRMTEIVDGAIVVTTDTDFRIYLRHGRQVVPSMVPS